MGLLYVLSAPQPASAAKGEVVDRVVAVVGDEIILLSDVQKAMIEEIQNRNINRNNNRALYNLQTEILEGLIDDRLLMEKALRDSIIPDPRDIDTVYRENWNQVRGQYATEEEFQQDLERNGLTEPMLRRTMRRAAEKEVIWGMLQQQIMMRVSVTPKDVEEWYGTYKDSLQTVPEQFKLSHINIIPEPDEARKDEVREKLEKIRERAMNGEDFSELAKQYSEDPGTRAQGGKVPPFDQQSGLYPEFIDAAYECPVGEVSPPFETLLGYHILKVEKIEEGKLHTRHILIRLEPSPQDEQRVEEQLSNFREQILSGEANFEDVAKEHSDDEYTRDLGGKFMWVTRGDLMQNNLGVFYEKAKSMEQGDITEPFSTSHGYHILRLDDYKPAHKVNPRDERGYIEEIIKQEKTMLEMERILSKLREDTYIRVLME